MRARRGLSLRAGLVVQLLKPLYPRGFKILAFFPFPCFTLSMLIAEGKSTIANYTSA